MSQTPVTSTSPSWTIPSPQRAAFPIVCKQWVISSLSRISRMADLLLSDSLEWLAWTPVLENRLIRYRSSLALGFSSSRVKEKIKVNCILKFGLSNYRPFKGSSLTKLSFSFDQIFLSSTLPNTVSIFLECKSQTFKVVTSSEGMKDLVKKVQNSHPGNKSALHRAV